MLGDNFVARSYRQFFNLVPDKQLFTKTSFDTYCFCNSRYTCNITNILIRMNMAIMEAIEKRKKLPKYVVIVMDNDIIEFVKTKNDGVAIVYGEYLESITKNMLQIFNDRKAQLPEKTRRENYPTIYWVAAPTHCNFYDNESRHKLNLCLESIVKGIDHMRIMRMKEIWSFEDKELVREGLYTPTGLAAYWQSVDATIKFNIIRNENWTSNKIKIKTPKFRKSFGETGRSQTTKKTEDNRYKEEIQDFFRYKRRQDRFYWSREREHDEHDHRRQRRSSSPKFILPKPSFFKNC